jgi:O-antigen ligase
MSALAKWLYLLFVASWFTHLSERLPILGVVRFDLILVVVLAVPAILAISRDHVAATPADRALWALIGFILLTLPLVEWPGSVVHRGLPAFIKAVIFYFYTVAFMRTPADLRRLVAVFVACQTWRVVEPLYLHITEGYWGSVAYMEGGAEMLERLSGAPSDVVNPNGLAFVICSVLSFALLLGKRTWKGVLVVAVLTPVCLYALMLTGSRTGFLGLAVVYLGVLLKAKRRLLVAVVGVAAAAYGASMLDAGLQDRYLSIIGFGSKNVATAEGRLVGLAQDFSVALNRPLFGHGLGTSAEANFHYSGYGQLSHNLYTEVAQELGFVGLTVFLWLMVSISRSFLATGRLARERANEDTFLTDLIDALQVWFAVVLLFSLASYGLSSYEWYLLAGFSMVIARLICDQSLAASRPESERRSGKGLVYVDFERGLGGFSRSSPADIRALDGSPAPGAIAFLREASSAFTVVICSPRCGTAQGVKAVSAWLARHGAPVAQLRFSSSKPRSNSGPEQPLVFRGRWPTVDELSAFGDGHRDAG